MNKGVLALSALLVLASVSYAATCKCRFQGHNRQCNTMTPGGIVDGAQTCTPGTVGCDGCVCDVLGLLDCEVVTTEVWRANGTLVEGGPNQFCSSVTSAGAMCPNVTAANVSTCCNIASLGSVTDNPCALQSFEALGAPGTLNRIHRVAFSSANITATATAGTSLAIVSTQYTLSTGFAYGPGEPAIYANFTVGPISQTGGTVPAGQTRVFNFTFSTTSYQTTLVPADSLFQQLATSTDPTFNYATTLTFTIGGQGAQTRVGSYLVRQCLYYEFTPFA